MSSGMNTPDEEPVTGQVVDTSAAAAIDMFTMQASNPSAVEDEGQHNRRAHQDNDSDNNLDRAERREMRKIWCIVFLVVLVSLVLPILLVVFANVYEDEITCTGRTASGVNLAETIGIPTWAKVHGGFGFVDVACLAVIVWSMLRQEASGAMAASLVTLVCTGLFRFCWIIVGAVLFWRDCPTCGPGPMCDLMTATIILGLLGIFLNGCARRAAGEDD